MGNCYYNMALDEVLMKVANISAWLLGLMNINQKDEANKYLKAIEEETEVAQLHSQRDLMVLAALPCLGSSGLH